MHGNADRSVVRPVVAEFPICVAGLANHAPEVAGTVEDLHAPVEPVRNVHLVAIHNDASRPVELPISVARSAGSARGPLAEEAAVAVEDLYVLVFGIRHVYLVTMHGNTARGLELQIFDAALAPLAQEHAGPVKNLYAVVAQIRHVYLVFVYGKTGRPETARPGGELPISVARSARSARGPLAEEAAEAVEDLHQQVAGIRHVYFVTMHGNTDHPLQRHSPYRAGWCWRHYAAIPLAEVHLCPGHNSTSSSKRADILTHLDGPSVQPRQVSSAISQEV